MEDEAKLHFLLDMTRQERELHYIHEDAREEQDRMDTLMDEYKWWGSEIPKVDGKMAAVFSAYRKRIRQDIKEAGDNIRWLRVRYKETMQSVNSQGSSKPS